MKSATVIGAGPAGLSSALGLKRLGYQVSLHEQRPALGPRVCGTFLNSEAMKHLEWLGVADHVRAHGVEVPKTRVTIPNGQETFISTTHENRVAVAIPRPKLEEILIDRIKSEGIILARGAVFGRSDLREPGAKSEYRAPIIFADGRFSIANKKAKPSDGWYGWAASFENVPQTVGLQSLHFFPRGYVGTVTYTDRSTHVCGLMKRNSSQKKVGDEILDEAMELSQPLANLLRNATRVSDWHGVGPLPFSFSIRNKQDLLTGDAAAVGDPFMGEGLGRALGAGPLLVAAAQQKGQWRDNYQKMWNKNYRKRLMIGSVVRSLISNSFFFKTSSKLFQNEFLISYLTPYFHLGFQHS